MATMSQTRGASRAVLLAMILYASRDTHLAFPGADLLVSASGQSMRAVTRAIPELTGLGEIEVLNDGRGRGRAGVYRLLVPDEEGRRPAPAAVTDRPLVNSVREVGKHAIQARKSAKNTPHRRDPRVIKGEGTKEDPLAPTASGGGTGPARRGLRSNGTNPRALAAQAEHERSRAAGAAAAAAIAPATPAHEQTWGALRDALRARVADSTFETWLASLMLCGVDGDGQLVVCGPAELMTWVRERFVRVLADAAAAADASARFCTPTEAVGLMPAAEAS